MESRESNVREELGHGTDGAGGTGGVMGFLSNTNHIFIIIGIIVFAYLFHDFTQWSNSPMGKSVEDILGQLAKLLTWIANNPGTAFSLWFLAPLIPALLGISVAAFRRFANRTKTVAERTDLSEEARGTAVEGLARQTKIESMAESGATSNAVVEAADQQRANLAEQQANQIASGTMSAEDVTTGNEAGKEAMEKDPPPDNLPENASVFPEAVEIYKILQKKYKIDE